MYVGIQKTFAFSVCVGKKANPSNQIPVSSPDKVNATKTHTVPPIPNAHTLLTQRSWHESDIFKVANAFLKWKYKSTKHLAPVTSKPKMLLTRREIVSFFFTLNYLWRSALLTVNVVIVIAGYKPSNIWIIFAIHKLLFRHKKTKVYFLLH
jgi:hypothetical protein